MPVTWPRRLIWAAVFLGLAAVLGPFLVAAGRGGYTILGMLIGTALFPAGFQLFSEHTMRRAKRKKDELGVGWCHYCAVELAVGELLGPDGDPIVVRPPTWAHLWTGYLALDDESASFHTLHSRAVPSFVIRVEEMVSVNVAAERLVNGDDTWVLDFRTQTGAAKFRVTEPSYDVPEWLASRVPSRAPE
jgi:hypothetical protein